jgi:hypothetical protein
MNLSLYFSKERPEPCATCEDDTYNESDQNPMITPLQSNHSNCVKCIKKSSNRSLVQAIGSLSRSTKKAISQTVANINTTNKIGYSKLIEENEALVVSEIEEQFCEVQAILINKKPSSKILKSNLKPAVQDLKGLIVIFRLWSNVQFRDTS